jgi:hypothetical protein
MISAYNIYAYKQQSYEYICTTLQVEITLCQNKTKSGNNTTLNVNIGNIGQDHESN